MQRSGPVLLVVAAALVAAPAAAASAGVIREFQVLSTAPAYGGATPLGAAGPYEVVTGTVHGELDPADPANAGIADLKLAPVSPDGMVAYSTDVVILQPVRAADARRVLFYDVVNRGRSSPSGRSSVATASRGGRRPPHSRRCCGSVLPSSGAAGRATCRRPARQRSPRMPSSARSSR
jgi:hypothetical protein